MKTIRNAALAIGAMFGRFGDLPTEPEIKPAHSIEGRNSFDKPARTVRKSRQTKKVKGHRRRYLCGKPWAI